MPALAPEHVAFAYSPLLETVLSLHVLVGPKHHGLQQPWVRSMRRLSQPLRKEIAALSFLYSTHPPNLLFPRADDALAMFDEELAQMLALDDDVLGLELSKPLTQDRGDAAALQRARARLGEPRALAERFANLLRAYWEAAFADEWGRLEPRLARAVADACRRGAAGSLYALVEALSPPLRVERSAERFGVGPPDDHIVEITAERPLVLIPSAYVWPHVVVGCEDPWPAALVYPAPFVVEDARPRIPDEELLRRLKALADDTRLRILRLIAERPRSTQELAPLVPLSEAGLSKHLRQLADAGLVETRREGYYVLYSLAEGGTAALWQALRTFLGGSR